MNRKEINLLGMIESVVGGLDNNQRLLNFKPAILAVQTKLKANIADIKILKQKQAVSTKADYAIKGYKKSDMIANMLVVAAGVAAVGAEKNDVKLKLAGAVTEPALNNMRESYLVVKGHALYEVAMTIPTELLGWDVTQDEIDDLGDSTDSYLSQNPTIRNIVAKSTQATSEMKEKLNESYNLIKDPLDALMLPFKKSNPTFYGEYLNNRLIIEVAATHSKPVEAKTEVK
jgi:hypothetical protein